MQVVLKVNHGSNRTKIPYIVDSDSKKRGCYARNMNYYKFEDKILEIIRKVCQIYANRKMLNEAYGKINDKTIDMLESIKKQIQNINFKLTESNKKLDQIYDDKINGILPESDFIRISKRYIKERDVLENKYSNLTDKFQDMQSQESTYNKTDSKEMDKVINDFLQMKEISKSQLYRLIDKIEIDKDKNVFILFNFAPLNTINENIDEFIEIEEIFQNDKLFENNNAAIL